jgi:Zn-dependent M16 (insulinase) family peptidase
VKSAFLDIQVSLDTFHLSYEQRLYLQLYLDCLFELPLEREGVIIPFEDVVKELDKKTVKRSTAVGLSTSSFNVSDFSQLISFKTKCSKERYAEVVKLMSELLWKSVFSVERLKVSVSKLLNAIPQEKREGMKVARTALKVLCFDKERSNHLACSIFNQGEFLEKLQARLDENPNSVVEELTVFRDSSEKSPPLLSFFVFRFIKNQLSSLL